MRAIHLSRDEAEMLVDLLEDFVRTHPNGYDLRIIWMADDLRRQWGMSPGLGVEYERGVGRWPQSQLTEAKREAAQ